VVDQSPKLARAAFAAAGVVLTRSVSTRLVSTRLALARLAGRGALVVALAAGFGLAGCGRKSGLDAPPLAAAGDQQAGQPGSAPGSASVSGPDGKPNAPATDKRHTLFDWLIN
jgi:hypothetical protein